MGLTVEEIVARACARWVAAIERRAVATLLAVVVLTELLGAYAALHLGVDADPKALIARDLPFQQRQRALAETFHTLADGILLVDADSPVVAGRAAEALAGRLATRTDLFSQVDVPGGGPLFARNVLLAFRSARVVVAIVASLLASLLWCNAFAAATVGALNQISATFNPDFPDDCGG